MFVGVREAAEVTLLLYSRYTTPAEKHLRNIYKIKRKY